jgi:hypothetical protein
MRHAHRPGIALAVAAGILAVLAAACAASGPATSPAPSNPGVTGPDSAMAAVRARSPLFDGIERKDPNKIGQGSWWDAPAGGNGWRVTVEVGWGDCQAGCISRHDWTWDVAADGSTAWVGEQGAQLDDQVLNQLQAASTAQGVGGWAFAGPTCPVERPGDSACARRMVGGAVLVVTGADGKEVARFTTDGSGLFRVHLDPGEYTVQAAPVQGLMGTPGPATAEVQAGKEVWLDVAYDTGIR